MARFAINQPITTREPTVTVDAGLAIGRHRFRLDVIDREGRASLPHEAIVEVQRTVVDPLPGPGPLDPIRPPLDPIRPPLDPVRPPIGPVRPIGRAAEPESGEPSAGPARPRSHPRKKKESS